MTHDPNVLNALYFSLDGRFFKLRADRCFFWHANCFSSMRVLPVRENFVGLVPFFFWSISRVGGVIISYMYYDTLFVT
jgi:hypothetical protein